MRVLAACLLSTATLLAHASGATSYGKAFAEGPAVPVSTAIAAFDAHAGAPRRFSGRITEVCQAKGCWMMLEHNGQAARVKFGDHDFFLPKDASGTAVVHGVLERKELTAEQAKHFSEDSSKRLPVAPVEYRIIADGVQVSASP
ncbi:DUF4920 domain-containing protein [Lysobacter olei]